MQVFVHSPDYREWGELGVQRQMMADLAVYAWGRMPGFWTRYTSPCSLSYRWRLAEQYAQEDNDVRTRHGGPSDEIYCLADDDSLPPADLTPNYIQTLFLLNPEFGLLAIGNPQADQGLYQDGNMVEVNSAGGIRFLRRGMVKEWPNNFTGDDNQHAGLIAPFRSAYLKRWALMHMGDGRSVWEKMRDHAGA